MTAAKKSGRYDTPEAIAAKMELAKAKADAVSAFLSGGILGNPKLTMGWRRQVWFGQELQDNNYHDETGYLNYVILCEVPESLYWQAEWRRQAEGTKAEDQRVESGRNRGQSRGETRQTAWCDQCKSMVHLNADGTSNCGHF